MTRFKKISLIILLTQLLLVQCQWLGYHPYEPFGYPYGAIPQLRNQPDNIAIPANSNQPNIIIIKDDDDDDRPTRKDKFRFEEILTLLLTRHLGRGSDRERETPPQQSDSCGCCCCSCGNCCCKNGNQCCCCNNQNNNNENKRNGGGTTMHITIVLPNNSVNKNDIK